MILIIAVTKSRAMVAHVLQVLCAPGAIIVALELADTFLIALLYSGVWSYPWRNWIDDKMIVC
ncbi:hypothetical protein J4460_01020 [Candidatus Woesearchaeota archaeon]|nr:hypothetical protein [Candidatus Woesearchaeota archaeon]HIH38535.1 hypothetical protein [Candidatus Woesearchaeota archaeon]HIH48490.1 hypothetical protein [Candidatus Woesearchaeota archaeon]HIJ02739.1 hypothetical protein [Candidatus Woesearchaeota archaeon]